MTMSPAALIAIDVITPARRSVGSRVAAAVRAAWARAEARRAYRRLLESDASVLRDIGVTRGDVRQALHDCHR
jgi:uncharacterized protein YjiS (DUF1127 family)